jgi:hypothetical protein
MSDSIAPSQRAAPSLGDAWNRFWFTPADPFSLAIVRVLVGVLALYWLATFTPDLERYFGPAGLLPLETVRAWSADSWRFSYLDFTSRPAELYVVHAAGLAVLVLFTVGLWTRITSILSLVVVLSYVHRAPMLTGQFEPVLSLVLLYLCLAPCGRTLSLDALLARRRADPLRPARVDSIWANVALRLLQIHLCVVYPMMALAKLRASVWWTGQAVWWLAARPDSRLVDLTGLLSLEARGEPIGLYLVNVWTHAVVAVELSFCVLVWFRRTRPALLVCSMIVWASLALVTGQTLFCLLMMAANLAFVPAETLRRWLRAERAAEPAAAGQASRPRAAAAARR